MEQKKRETEKGGKCQIENEEIINNVKRYIKILKEKRKSEKKLIKKR